jgi:hypothetical protein
MYTGLGKLSIQSEKWRSGVVMFLNVKFCYEIQHFWVYLCKDRYNTGETAAILLKY